MQEAYLQAIRNANKSSTDASNHQDKKVTFIKLLTGDRVLVWNMSECGGLGKLCLFLENTWENNIHRVIIEHGCSLVYEAAPESRNGRTNVLYLKHPVTL